MSDRTSWIRGRDKTLDDCIKEYFLAMREPVPPVHVTDLQGLRAIRAAGHWQQPARGGASFSPPGIGTLRNGDVAIRVKPGSEDYVEMRHSSSAFGLVPLFWPDGIGQGSSKSYVLIEHLQYYHPLRPPIGDWIDIADLPG